MSKINPIEPRDLKDIKANKPKDPPIQLDKVESKKKPEPEKEKLNPSDYLRIAYHFLINELMDIIHGKSNIQSKLIWTTIIIIAAIIITQLL